MSTHLTADHFCGPHDPIQAAIDLRPLWTPAFARSLRDAQSDEERQQLCVDFVSRVRELKAKPLPGRMLYEIGERYLDRLEAQAAAGEPTVEPLAVESWEQLVDVEPRLAAVERKAQQLRPIAADNWRAYEGIKRDLSRLAGWEAVNPLLRSSAAYDVAHRRLKKALGC